LSYFDIFDYPLTPMEIWKWLYVGDQAEIPELKEVMLFDVMTLCQESAWLKNHIEEQDGFYFLKGRKGIVTIRQQRYLWAEDKFHRAMKVIKWLRWVPFVRMIGVCNTLAYNNSRRGGDIDLFVITSRHRTWQVRFWVNSILKLLRLRPTAENTQDKLCSSFFVDIDHVYLEKLAIQDDIYLPYWVTQVYPVYDEGAYTTFVQANEWVRQALPNWLPIEPVGRRQVKAYRWAKRMKELFFFFLPESLFRAWQQKIMPENLRAMANKDTRVVVNDSVLKFHDTDRRQSFLEQWRVRKGEALKVT
ncbi:MAG: hypothetical protein WCT27_03550, partial [Patescibacteria group bacterium]